MCRQAQTRTETLLLVLLGFALVLLNGLFFVAAEFAIVKRRRMQADELAHTHGLRGKVLRAVRARLEAYRSACQLGITLASLGLGWIGEPAFARLLEPAFAHFDVIDPQVLHSIAFAAAFTYISFLYIVLGELAPKSIAIRRAEAVSSWRPRAMRCTRWMYCEACCTPVIVMANSWRSRHGSSSTGSTSVS